MDRIKKINEDQLNEIIAVHGFDRDLMLKDYYITLILFLIKDIGGIYLKGGTALQKIFLNYTRLSEDIDFTLTRNIEQVINEIKSMLSNFSITKDKHVEGFTRLVVHYKDFAEGTVFIDLNARAKLLLKPEKHEIKHFYRDHIPLFSVPTLAREEMIAEKVIAAIQRNQPRDHYDIYRIIKAHIPINIELVKKKCEQTETEFNIINMFNRAKKLKNRWDSDMIPLLAEDISFEKVMITNAKYFNLKQEKEKKKKEKRSKHRNFPSPFSGVVRRTNKHPKP